MDNHRLVNSLVAPKVDTGRFHRLQANELCSSEASNTFIPSADRDPGAPPSREKQAESRARCKLPCARSMGGMSLMILKIASRNVDQGVQALVIGDT
jgi:hypothetical protein